jgi:hypothetical protein
MPGSEAKGGPEIRRRQAIAAGCRGLDAALAGTSQGRQSLSPCPQEITCIAIRAPVPMCYLG